ncbi:hypothetical protein U2F26_20240 [Micromonospora sp. 4G57]|uniref:Uncharacterized protein n=2 Tax=Micromonospora TaxID=1873 RepID=A0ABU5JE17_9ACTN|nr:MULTISPECIES: hypothetical protein [unclassified Micromonospora]MDZ5445045.1 hypothetical protein [Micromonospora sp. 4G57]MDZ5490835.1 hypothetical protein [Micromonospora sp. 4G53]
MVLSEIGTRGTVAANLCQVYDLTGAIAYTGPVGVGQAVALLVLSPLGGAAGRRRSPGTAGLVRCLDLAR